MISYEEYRAIVVEQFRYYWKALSDEEVEAYFERDGNEITRESYEDDVESLKRGEIIERALEKSCPESVAYCLSLMY